LSSPFAKVGGARRLASRGDPRFDEEEHARVRATGAEVVMG